MYENTSENTYEKKTLLNKKNTYEKHVLHNKTLLNKPLMKKTHL